MQEVSHYSVQRLVKKTLEKLKKLTDAKDYFQHITDFIAHLSHVYCELNPDVHGRRQLLTPSATLLRRECNLCGNDSDVLVKPIGTIGFYNILRVQRLGFLETTNRKRKWSVGRSRRLRLGHEWVGR